MALTMAVCLGCGRAPEPRQEALRLARSVEKYLGEYRESLDTENRLAEETLRWLDGAAISAPRTQAVSESRRLTDRWARVYFVPRYMHEQLRMDRYESAAVRKAHLRLLQHLQRRYFELHDYQRYAQHAAETGMHRTPAGRLPLELEEFRVRLRARKPAVDEIGPLLDSLAHIDTES